MTELYDLPEVSDLREHYASSSVTEWIRTVLEKRLRSAILSGEVTTLPTLEELGDRICRVAARESLPSLRPVINATGVVLHTNLGRGLPGRPGGGRRYTTSRGAIPPWSTTWTTGHAGQPPRPCGDRCCAVSPEQRPPWW